MHCEELRHFGYQTCDMALSGILKRDMDVAPGASEPRMANQRRRTEPAFISPCLVEMPISVAIRAMYNHRTLLNCRD